MSDIPEWAFDHAEVLYAEMAIGVIDEMPHRKSFHAKAFAKYISEHEEAPVDPLLIEAREIAASLAREWLNETCADYYLDGDYDNDEVIKALVKRLAALKSREQS